MATDEQKDGHERHGSPQVAALHDGIDISPEQYACSSDSNNGGDDRDPFNVVDGSLYFGVRSIRHVASDPGVNYLSSCAPIFRTLVRIIAALLTGHSPAGKVVSQMIWALRSMGAGGGREHEEDRGSCKPKLFTVSYQAAMLTIYLEEYVPS